MIIVYDHRTDPPTRLTAHGSCVAAPNYVSAPLANLPDGLYIAGHDDPVPAGMVAVAWTRVIRDGLSVAVPTCEPEPAAVPPEVAESAAIMASADAVEAVHGVLAAVQTVASLGVDIADWSFQGVAAAAQQALGGADTTRGLALIAASQALSAAWARVVYHCHDSLREADRLWPYLYDAATA